MTFQMSRSTFKYDVGDYDKEYWSTIRSHDGLHAKLAEHEHTGAVHGMTLIGNVMEHSPSYEVCQLIIAHAHVKHCDEFMLEYT